MLFLHINITIITNIYAETCMEAKELAVAVCHRIFSAVYDGTLVAVRGGIFIVVICCGIYGGIFCAARGKICGAVSKERFVARSDGIFLVVYGDEKYTVGTRGKGTYGTTTGERKKSRSWLYLGDSKRESDIKGLSGGQKEKW